MHFPRGPQYSQATAVFQRTIRFRSQPFKYAPEPVQGQPVARRLEGPVEPRQEVEHRFFGLLVPSTRRLLIAPASWTVRHLSVQFQLGCVPTQHPRSRTRTGRVIVPSQPVVRPSGATLVGHPG